MYINFVNYIGNKDQYTLKVLLYQNLEYFYNNNEGTLIFLINDKVQYKYSAKHFLNYLCTLNLTSIKAYNKAINDLFSYKYKNPVVLGNTSIILSGNSNNLETIYFNFENVIKIKESNENESIITFKSGRAIKINKNNTFINNQIIKIEKLKRYLKWNFYNE